VLGVPEKRCHRLKAFLRTSLLLPPLNCQLNVVCCRVSRRPMVWSGKPGRGRSRYQNLRWALANQGGITSDNSRPYGMRVYFYAKKHQGGYLYE